MSALRPSTRPFSDLDPSSEAQGHLNDILSGGNAPEPFLTPDEALLPRRESAPADQVRTGARILNPTSERNKTRLLIVTKNVTARQLGSKSQRRLVELSRMFAEIHVLILNEFTEMTVSTVRLTDNVWLYSTDSETWWKMGLDAYRIANEQLIFADAFRADIIVGEDPFESGAIAYLLARKYERPFQIHILEDIYAPEFQETTEHIGWRMLLASFVIKRANTIRTATTLLRERIAHEFEEKDSVTEALPLYYNLSQWRDMEPAFTLEERYPQFKLCMLHISRMQTSSHTKEVIQGVAPLLRLYPTLGLIIVGSGPQRSALEKQVITLGISRQVEFEPVPDEVISHMKTAGVLIQLTEDAAEDLTILEAAAVRLPIIATKGGIAGTLFTDNESAYLCPGADPACVSQKLKAFLNDSNIRIQFGAAAQEIVFKRIEQDYQHYLAAYQNSVERCIGAGSQVA